MRLISYNPVLRKIVAVSLVLLFVQNLTGCAFTGNQKEYSTTGFAFNTTYTITLYQGGSQELLNQCTAKCAEYEQVFSRTDSSSELFQINEILDCYRQVIPEKKMQKLLHGGTLEVSDSQRKEWKQAIEEKRSSQQEVSYEICPDGTITFQVSELLYRILEQGQHYGTLSEGAFTVTIEPVSALWDFTGESTEPPEAEEIRKALPFVNDKGMSLQTGKVIFSFPGMGLDLGGIAKGFIADELKQYLKEQGVTSGLINLGGNILCIGEKAEKQPFVIGVQQPFADRNETIATIYASDQSVVSSGIYERYFQTEDGKQYHHILNPATGYSWENDLQAVTIVSETSVEGDGLSTTCFALGLEQGMKLVESLEHVEAVFITTDEKMHYSGGFEKLLVN